MLFVAVYCVLYLCYSAIPDSILRDNVYFYGIVRPSEALINWLAPAEHVVGTQNRLLSATVRLNIVRGCDGAGVLFLLLAAMLAYRARLATTVLGIVGAVLLVYALNEMRVVALYFIDSHWPEWFLPMHLYFIPTLMILVGAVYFALWIGEFAGDVEPSTQA